jgi:DNA-directed RNA polymerase subunit RPC12/RpoP
MQRANELMAIEDYTAAVRAFEELANAASARNGPAVPHLYLQAGRANFKAGQVVSGMSQIELALKIFAERGEWLKFQRNRRRIVKELRMTGLENEANSLANFLEEQLPAEVKSIGDEPRNDPRPVARARATLPTKCPECGAPLRIDEVDWMDENTAECPYCGNITRN